MAVAQWLGAQARSLDSILSAFYFHILFPCPPTNGKYRMTKSKRLSIYSCMLTGNRYCIQHLWQGVRIEPDERHQGVSQLCFWDNREWLPVDTQKGRKLWSFQCHCWPTCDGEVPSPSHLPGCKTIHGCVNTFLSLIPRDSTSSFFSMQKKKGVVEVWRSGHMLWMK